MWNKINRILKGQLVTSLLYTLLGLCFVLMPVDAVNAICKFVFGILLILAGIYHILIYVLEKMNATLLDLLSGGMLLVIGSFSFLQSTDRGQASSGSSWNLCACRFRVGAEGKPASEKVRKRRMENSSDRKPCLYRTWNCNDHESLYHDQIYSDLCGMCHAGKWCC